MKTKTNKKKCKTKKKEGGPLNDIDFCITKCIRV